ncbi:MAG: RNA polymerase sigma factor [Acidiferrobacterales bacterium]|nr:RNA polymerase sigma factor [Acidiferrobacterales bacterium]
MVNLWSNSAYNKNRFENLVSPHIDHLYRLSYRFTGSREDSEDLVQDLLVKLYPRLEEIEAIEKLKPWLAQVLYRLFIDRTRQHKRSVLSVVEDSMEPDSQLDGGAGTEELAAGTLTRERLQESFAVLNEDQRALLSLHDIEGYTLAELVDVLDVPLGTLKSRLNRSRAKLREHLSREPFVENQRVNR